MQHFLKGELEVLIELESTAWTQQTGEGFSHLFAKP